MNKRAGAPESQRGAVLIVALIMLLLLTMIGMASMRGTSLQENMAGNLRESNLSFQAAEAALREGEDFVKKSAVSQAELMDFLDKLEMGDIEGSYSGFPGVSKDPKYVISILAEIRTITNEVLYDGILVRVSSTGYGLSSNASNSPIAVTHLRSTFMVEL